ncbi:MAG TPA: metallophosphoesterase [bacterium]|nr:metallophosphoesterase [bacterium]
MFAFFSILVFLFLVISGHYFAWHLCLSAFPSWHRWRFWILSAFVAVTFIFLGDFIWLHQGDSAFFRYLYVFGAILFGLLSQLMLFGFLFYLHEILLKHWTGKRLRCASLQPRLVARLLLILAGLFFILGTYNAFLPRVKTIVLRGWPEELKGKSFVQLSDLHLGAVYRPAWLEMIVRKVNALNPDFVVISSDLFDGSDEHLSEFIPVLRTFSPVTIFVPGNHDYYIPAEKAQETALAGNLIFLSDAAINVDGLEVIGLNYVNRDDSGLRREIKNLGDGQLTRIVVNHVPVDQAEAKALEARLMLSGHTHRGQIFPFSFFTYLLYGRFSYGLENYEGMTTYTNAGTGTWGPPVRTLLPGEIIRFVIE